MWLQRIIGNVGLHALLLYGSFNILCHCAKLGSCPLPMQVTFTVEFRRIWWDKHVKHPSLEGISFWQPLAPPGYVSLGDAMVVGRYCPPDQVLVVRDLAHEEALQQSGPPPLARPIKFTLVRMGSACIGRWLLEIAR